MYNYFCTTKGELMRIQNYVNYCFPYLLMNTSRLSLSLSLSFSLSFCQEHFFIDYKRIFSHNLFLPILLHKERRVHTLRCESSAVTVDTFPCMSLKKDRDFYNPILNLNLRFRVLIVSYVTYAVFKLVVSNFTKLDLSKFNIF
jgi:hypothetical protein